MTGGVYKNLRKKAPLVTECLMSRWVKWLIVIGAAALVFEVVRRAREADLPFDLDLLDEIDIEEMS